MRTQYKEKNDKRRICCYNERRQLFTQKEAWHMQEYELDTRCVQAGYTPGNGEPRQIPVVQSTTFRSQTG